MKITQQTPNRLSFAGTPWLIGILLLLFISPIISIGFSLISQDSWIGTLVFLTGCGLVIGLTWAFVRQTHLTLDRSANSLTLRTRSLFGLTQVNHTLTALSHAVLESKIAARGGILYRATLIFDETTGPAPLPVTTAYVNSNNPGKMVTTINAWLNPDQPQPILT